MAVVVGVFCLGYLLFVGTLLSELRQPVGTQPPRTNAPASFDRDTTGSRADRADRDRDARHRSPSGRSAPPSAGDPRQ